MSIELSALRRADSQDRVDSLVRWRTGDVVPFARRIAGRLPWSRGSLDERRRPTRAVTGSGLGMVRGVGAHRRDRRARPRGVRPPGERAPPPLGLAGGVQTPPPGTPGRP